jgi:flagellin-specific chaperone FliS
MVEWYESLIDMMRREEVTEKGHLQMNKNVLGQLVALHQTLLKDPRFAEYTAEFYRTLPFIVELRAKAGAERVGEIETCFNALYAMLMLRLQHKEISKETLTAMQQITKFISVLATDFHLDEADKLFKHDDEEENSGC